MGNEQRRNGEISKVKQYNLEGKSNPYVSTQALKKWIRTSINKMTNDYSYYERIKRKSPLKKDLNEPEGLSVDPIYYIEDELFGYSHPLIESPEQDDPTHLYVVTTNRLAPYQVSALIGVPNTVFISETEGWVHPVSDTPLPFNTELMSGMFQGSATLDLNRIGRYRNFSDIYEIDPYLADYYVGKDELQKISNNRMTEYVRTDKTTSIVRCAKMYYDSLLNLYGAAKTTQFATDLSPRVMVSAVLNSANNLFFDLIEADFKGKITINWDIFERRIENRSSTIDSDVYFGYRSGTLDSQVEDDLHSRSNKEIGHSGIKLRVTSPGAVKSHILEHLGGNV